MSETKHVIKVLVDDFRKSNDKNERVDIVNKGLTFLMTQYKSDEELSDDVAKSFQFAINSNAGETLITNEIINHICQR